jgi:chromosome segregation ATPase
MPEPCTTTGFDKQIFLEGGKEFEELIERLRQGKRELEHFKSFLEDRIGMEEGYAKDKAKLLTKHKAYLSELVEFEETQGREALRPLADLKKTVIPKLESLIKEQKRVKDAQKAAISGTTKKMVALGSELSKLAEKLSAKESEAAGLNNRIALTSKEEEKLNKQREKSQSTIDKYKADTEATREKLQNVFAEWRGIADQARQLISRHEEERVGMFKELVEEYKQCLSSRAPSNNNHTTRISRKPSSILLDPPISNNHNNQGTSSSNANLNASTSMYRESMEKLGKINKPPSYDTACHPEPGQGDKVQALYPYTALSSEEISFGPGDVIDVLDRQEDPWWRGRLRSSASTGLFPSNFVRKL